MTDQTKQIRPSTPLRRLATFGVVPVMVFVLPFAACRSPHDNMRVMLDRHARASARMPEGEPWRDRFGAEGAVDDEVDPLLPDGELTVEVARAVAVRANPDIHAAQARLEMAAARIAEAQSRYYPTLLMTHNSARTFHVPASRNRFNTLLQPPPALPSNLEGQNFAVTTLLNAIRRPLFGPGAIKGSTSSFSEHSSGFTLTWTLFDGFIREAQVLAAKYLREAGAQALIDAQRLIVQAVDTAYYQVQLAEEQVRIARADEAFSQEQYEETEKLLAAGRATRADADNFRVRVLAAKANLTAAIGRRDTGRVVLAELMGVPEGLLPEDLHLSPLTDETDEEMSVPEVHEWLERALKTRPDLQQLKALLETEEENVRVVQGTFSPTVTVSGSWGFDRTSTVRYRVDDQSSAAAIEFRWELFSGGRRRAQLWAAESARAAATAVLHRQRLAVQSGVRTAIIDLSDAQTQIRLQRENVITATENRRMIRAAYVAGKETLSRLNEAQRDYIAAEVNLALARIRLRQAWTDLYAAAGARE